MLRHNNEGLTAIDIAGKHKKHESALLLLYYITGKFNLIKDSFFKNNKGNQVLN